MKTWMRTMSALFGILLGIVAPMAGAQTPAQPPTPTGIAPASITYEDVPYPFPSSYLPLAMYGQDVRIAYMDAVCLPPPDARELASVNRRRLADDD